MHLDKFILIIFPLIILFNFLIIKNFRLLFLYKTVDKEFNKPQAFHSKPVPRIGGFLILFFLFCFLFFSSKKTFFF